MPHLNRRDLVVSSFASVAFLAMNNAARAFPLREGETVLSWLDQPPAFTDPCCDTQLVWEQLDSWITPNDKFFNVSHFDRPTIDEAGWKLEVDGLVEIPLSFSLSDLKARPKQEVAFTIECSGNHGFPNFTGAIGNAKWAGTPLRAILEDAKVKNSGIEVVFWGADVGDIALKDAVRDVKMKQNFARSMSLEDAMNPDNILCYEMNGQPLPATHGFPIRLIAPGWYGVANVKWLKRIEIRDRRFVSLLMGRDYVTIREEEHNGETVWAETSVGRSQLKSAPARVTKKDNSYQIIGAAWGAPIASVDIKIDDGQWQQATIEKSEDAPFAWKIWQVEWPAPKSGEYTITSRAVDTAGNVQPAMDDPWIAKKHTYWESNGQVTRRIQIN